MLLMMAFVIFLDKLHILNPMVITMTISHGRMIVLVTVSTGCGSGGCSNNIYIIQHIIIIHHLIPIPMNIPFQ